jgi:hypothetical protein
MVEFTQLDGGILRVCVRGLRDLETTYGYWEAILGRIARERPERLLVIDELLGEELSASEGKALVEPVVGRGLEGIPIAHVKPFAMDQLNYCEQYANAAGLDARVFRSEDEALDRSQGGG